MMCQYRVANPQNKTISLINIFFQGLPMFFCSQFMVIIFSESLSLNFEPVKLTPFGVLIRINISILKLWKFWTLYYILRSH